MLIRKAVGVNLEQSVIITLNISGVQRVKKKKNPQKNPRFCCHSLAVLKFSISVPFS